jgi:hypothetical protein
MTTANYLKFLDLMISCKYISFLQDFVNFKSFLIKKIKAKELLKEWSKADVNEGKFVSNIDVLFAFLFFIYFIYLALPTRAGSPQQHMPITMGPFYLTHPVNFPCGRKPDYLGKTHDFRQSVDFYSFHMRTGF